LYENPLDPDLFEFQANRIVALGNVPMPALSQLPAVARTAAQQQQPVPLAPAVNKLPFKNQVAFKMAPGAKILAYSGGGESSSTAAFAKAFAAASAASGVAMPIHVASIPHPAGGGGGIYSNGGIPGGLSVGLVDMDRLSAAQQPSGELLRETYCSFLVDCFTSNVYTHRLLVG
jgi:hypothetical protein